MKIKAINNFNMTSLLNIVVNLLKFFVLEGVIRFACQMRQRTAGLRTNTVEAVSAAVFIALDNRLNGSDGAVHMAAYVVWGVGFLGARVIMKQVAKYLRRQHWGEGLGLWVFGTMGTLRQLGLCRGPV